MQISIIIHIINRYFFILVYKILWLWLISCSLLSGWLLRYQCRLCLTFQNSSCCLLQKSSDNKRARPSGEARATPIRRALQKNGCRRTCIEKALKKQANRRELKDPICRRLNRKSDAYWTNTIFNAIEKISNAFPKWRPTSTRNLLYTLHMWWSLHRSNGKKY